VPLALQELLLIQAQALANVVALLSKLQISAWQQSHVEHLGWVS
jgi:hypothetical protein